MTASEKAAREIYHWLGSEEFEDLLCSDLSMCEHEQAKNTPDQVDGLCVQSIRQIILKHLPERP